jgi:hypothetical protein
MTRKEKMILREGISRLIKEELNNYNEEFETITCEGDAFLHSISPIIGPHVASTSKLRTMSPPGYIYQPNHANEETLHSTDSWITCAGRRIIPPHTKAKTKLLRHAREYPNSIWSIKVYKDS